jgi:hypothetical protein
MVSLNKSFASSDSDSSSSEEANNKNNKNIIPQSGPLNQIPVKKKRKEILSHSMSSITPYLASIEEYDACRYKNK